MVKASRESAGQSIHPGWSKHLQWLAKVPKVTASVATASYRTFWQSEAMTILHISWIRVCVCVCLGPLFGLRCRLFNTGPKAGPPDGDTSYWRLPGTTVTSCPMYGESGLIKTVNILTVLAILISADSFLSKPSSISPVGWQSPGPWNRYLESTQVCHAWSGRQESVSMARAIT